MGGSQLPLSCKLHSPGHRSADRISHGAVTIGPFHDATKICTRVGFNSDPRSRGQWAGRNGVVHTQDAVIVRLAIDDDLDPAQNYAGPSRLHSNQTRQATRLSGAKKPPRRRRATSAADGARHVSGEMCTVGSSHRHPKTIFEDRRGTAIGVFGLCPVIAKVLDRATHCFTDLAVRHGARLVFFEGVARSCRGGKRGRPEQRPAMVPLQ